MRNLLIAGMCVAIAGAAHADSLFSKRTADRGALISDKNPDFKPGDIIVVQVYERVDAATEAETQTRKQSEVSSEADAGDNSFLVAPKPNGFGITEAEKLPNWGVETDNEHRTQGETVRTNELTMTVSCVVLEVMENGNLLVEGEKSVSVNRETSQLYVRGLVRARDVSFDNTVSSDKLAAATIELRGKGPLWNNQRRGFFTRLLDWVSPY